MPAAQLADPSPAAHRIPLVLHSPPLHTLRRQPDFLRFLFTSFSTRRSMSRSPATPAPLTAPNPYCHDRRQHRPHRYIGLLLSFFPYLSPIATPYTHRQPQPHRQGNGREGNGKEGKRRDGNGREWKGTAREGGREREREVPPKFLATLPQMPLHISAPSCLDASPLATRMSPLNGLKCICTCMR